MIEKNEKYIRFNPQPMMFLPNSSATTDTAARGHLDALPLLLTRSTPSARPLSSSRYDNKARPRFDGITVSTSLHVNEISATDGRADAGISCRPKDDSPRKPFPRRVLTMRTHALPAARPALCASLAAPIEIRHASRSFAFRTPPFVKSNHQRPAGRQPRGPAVPVYSRALLPVALVSPFRSQQPGQGFELPRHDSRLPAYFGLTPDFHRVWLLCCPHPCSRSNHAACTGRGCHQRRGVKYPTNFFSAFEWHGNLVHWLYFTT